MQKPACRNSTVPYAMQWYMLDSALDEGEGRGGVMSDKGGRRKHSLWLEESDCF